MSLCLEGLSIQLNELMMRLLFLGWYSGVYGWYYSLGLNTVTDGGLVLQAVCW